MAAGLKSRTPGYNNIYLILASEESPFGSAQLVGALCSAPRDQGFDSDQVTLVAVWPKSLSYSG